MRFALLLLLVGGCGAPQPLHKVEWIAATNEPVEQQVARELGRAHREGRKLLVYVGATWCEPCKHFHDAVQRGLLDERFGSLRLVEFDLDRDAERLAVAGYAPKLIPLFTVPDTNGRATSRTMEGSIKGDGAVDQIVPRLTDLTQP